jgi:hypothetical protein
MLQPIIILLLEEVIPAHDALAVVTDVCWEIIREF